MKVRCAALRAEETGPVRGRIRVLVKGTLSPGPSLTTNRDLDREVFLGLDVEFGAVCRRRSWISLDDDVNGYMDVWDTSKEHANGSRVYRCEFSMYSKTWITLVAIVLIT